MLRDAIGPLLLAIIAAALGFGVLAGTPAMIAKGCFAVFLFLFLFSYFRGRKV